jgi:hypothetical protein
MLPGELYRSSNNRLHWMLTLFLISDFCSPLFSFDLSRSFNIPKPHQ